jgi:hypothetical protein
MLCFSKNLPWHLTLYKSFLYYICFGGIAEEFRKWKKNRKI